MLCACHVPPPPHARQQFVVQRNGGAGLSSAAAAIVKTLDTMYAGQIVMKQYCDSYGHAWSAWPPDAFEAVQRRHEELVSEVRCCLLSCRLM